MEPNFTANDYARVNVISTIYSTSYDIPHERRILYLRNVYVLAFKGESERVEPFPGIRPSANTVSNYVDPFFYPATNYR